MIGERVAYGGTGDGSGTFSWQGSAAPKLAAITVSGCHLIPVICVQV